MTFKLHIGKDDMSSNNPRNKLSRKKIIAFYLMAFIAFTVFISSPYFAYNLYQAYSIYGYVKTSQRGWSGKVHRADAELGFAPIPNARGAHVFPIGPDIPMRYDENGFRVPVTESSASSNQRPLILALGCSFTYGDATPAEETSPYLVGQYLRGTVKNAEVCSREFGSFE
jgi:hypothetical protein